MKNLTKILSGFLIGIINSFLGTGGGIIAISNFKKDGMNQIEAHANALFLTLLLSIISASIYLFKGNVDFSNAFNFIPLGIIGSIVGSFIMPKMPNKLLRKIFAAFMIFAGTRMIFK